MKDLLVLTPSLSNVQNKLEKFDALANSIWELTLIICGTLIALMILLVILSKIRNR